MRKQKPICFVIMGFGKKTDPSNGITYDLNKTYSNIIRPSVIEAGFECVRADEIKDSGLIDKSMYALLMQADLVVADITTYNPNAIYELGIRHAVRPYSTIILKEKNGQIPFDLDHNRMFMYSHLGVDIGVDEAKRCKQELIILIKNISKTKNTDSPLYEFIKDINPPKLPKKEYLSIINELAEQEKYIFAIVEKAKEAMNESDFITASKYWEKANTLVSNEPYFIQQRALCVYKSKEPSENTALIDALKIIEELEPDGSTNDPETLGITGAIYKQLWQLNQDMESLERAIEYYGKCFKIRNDYYTGENYALCLNLKASVEKDENEKIYAQVLAKKVRTKIIKTLSDIVAFDDFEKRVDKMWILATLSHCYYAVGEDQLHKDFEKKFLNEDIKDWEKDTYLNNKKLLTKIIKE
jgi:tetratricopeptide (TPR) repeat protein